MLYKSLFLVFLFGLLNTYGTFNCYSSKEPEKNINSDSPIYFKFISENINDDSDIVRIKFYGYEEVDYNIIDSIERTRNSEIYRSLIIIEDSTTIRFNRLQQKFFNCVFKDSNLNILSIELPKLTDFEVDSINLPKLDRLIITANIKKLPYQFIFPIQNLKFIYFNNTRFSEFPVELFKYQNLSHIAFFENHDLVFKVPSDTSVVLASIEAIGFHLCENIIIDKSFFICKKCFNCNLFDCFGYQIDFPIFARICKNKLNVSNQGIFRQLKFFMQKMFYNSLNLKN